MYNQSILLTAIIALHVISCWAQFPAVCNTNDSISSKTCCPNNCSGMTRGECTNITSLAVNKWSLSDPKVTARMLNSTNIPGKGKADVRYQWPIVVFEKVCVCKENYYGADCTECKFGYTGIDCNTKAAIRTRKQFSSLTAEEKAQLTRGYSDLKNESGRYAVTVDEPASYASGSVTLENVTTYDMIVYLHFLASRGSNCFEPPMVDFAHGGPVFLVWHRHYLLTVEREFQRILEDESFSFPYWSWETFEMDMFTFDYLGAPATDYSEAVNVTAKYFNRSNWPMVCDLFYTDQNVSCGEGWQLCNPNRDRLGQRPLQRGKSFDTAYLPNEREIKIALAAPSYDSSDAEGLYSIESPRASFRNRLEGFSQICSVIDCVGDYVQRSHVHNVVHLWLGGQMLIVPSAVNDPIFSLHHCNIDRLFESWIRRFNPNGTDELLLPGYSPSSGGHPGHNMDDWMVPFFPLVTPRQYYKGSTSLGFIYEELIAADLDDVSIANCDINDVCPLCSSNGSCISCSSNQTSQCPTPKPLELTSAPLSNQNVELGLGLGLGLGIPLLISLIALVIILIFLLVCCLVPKNLKGYESATIEMS